MNILGADFVAYQTHDIERAIAFYRDTLKLNMTFYGEDFGWAKFDVPPTTLAVYDPRKAADHEPNIGGGSLALAVEDVDETVQELKDQGVNIFAERIDQAYAPSRCARIRMAICCGCTSGTTAPTGRSVCNRKNRRWGSNQSPLY